MEKQYGILMQKHLLNEDTFLFKPITILEGEYQEDSELFFDEISNDYLCIDDEQFIDSGLEQGIAYVISESQLKEKYHTDDLVDAKGAFFDDLSEMIHLGVYNDDEEKIKLLQLHIDEIKGLSKVLSTTEAMEPTDTTPVLETREKDTLIFMTKQYIDNLYNLETIEAIKEKLDEVREMYNGLPLEDEEINNEPEELTEEEIIVEAAKANEQAALPVVIEKNKKFDFKVDAKKLYTSVTDRVIGQDDAVKQIVSAIVMDRLSMSPNERTRCLLVGPTGCGKTEIIRSIGDHIGIPFVRADSTQITIPGYVGGTIEEVLERLVVNAGGNVEKAQHGIVAFDEIDKKGSEKNSDISGKGVLNTLLPFIDGTDYVIKVNGRSTNFNTSNLVIFASGAFTNVLNEKFSVDKKGIGFGQELKTKISGVDMPKLEPTDLIKIGMMPDEFIGRFSVIAKLDPLSHETLKSILVGSSVSPLTAEYRKLNKLGVELDWEDTFVDEVSKLAMKKNLGARSLKSIIEACIQEARWEILCNPDKYSKLELLGETASDNKQYRLSMKG